MKGRVIVLDQRNGRAAAALMVDGRIEDLILGPSNSQGHLVTGDICSARVTRKLPKVGAFCKLPSGQDGYLRDAKSVREGDTVLVQVVSLPEPGKATTLTTRLLFKGPRLILTPGAPGVNVSRQIGNDAERQRLGDCVHASLSANPALSDKTQMGVIVRTSARNEADADLARELNVLTTRWAERTAPSPQKAGPSESSGAQCPDVFREWLFPCPDKILCTSEMAQTLSASDPETGPPAFFGDARFATLLQSDPDPFETAGILDALDTIQSAEVRLDGGASMVVEPTRAIVAVDVNTGADFSPAAGLKANLATARDLPRQMRLRGLGGQIVVDFAPMPKQHRKTLEEALKKAFRADPVETSLVGWTSLGLYELQRKRERYPLSEVL